MKHEIWTARPGRELYRMTVEGPSTDALLKSAREGNFSFSEGLMSLTDGEEAGDALSYRWLLIAQDLGHQEAAQWLDMLLETSSLQYDDDQFITGGVHFDLGLAYLRGEDGVRKDTVLARKHLQAAKERHFPLSAEVNGSKVIAESRSSLNPDQLGAFNSVFQVSHPSKEGTKSGDKIKPEKLLKPED